MKGLRVTQLLCIAVALNFILLAMWVPPGSCAPAETKVQRNIYRILSENSGKHVGVTRGGRVHAHASNPTRRTLFYPSFNQSDRTMKFESVKFRGRYLIMDEQKSRLRLSEPQNGNERFIVEKVNLLFSVMRAANNINCFVAFDQAGELIDPCSVSEKDPQTRVFLDIYD